MVDAQKGLPGGRRFRLKPGMTTVGAGMTNFLYSNEDRFSEITSVSRGPGLVEDDLELRLSSRQVEHRLQEVLSELGVQPGCAENQVIDTRLLDILLSVQFGQTVNAGRGPLLVLLARGIVRIGAKDVVRGDMYEQAADFLHGNGQILRSLSIQQLNKLIFLGIFCAIHIRPRSAVDDSLHVTLLHHLADGLQIGNVQLGGGSIHVIACQLVKHLQRLRMLITDIRENELILGALADNAYFVTQLPVGSRHKNIHKLFS